MKDKVHCTLALWILFALVTSVIPHPPNCSALLPCAFMIGSALTPKRALLLSLLLAVIINFLLSLIYAAPMLSLWLCFSLSGIIMVTIMGIHPPITWQRIMQFSTVYWLWTNLYVWLFCNCYPFSLVGLLHCYTAAIPFLSYSILGNLTWLYLLPLTLNKLQGKYHDSIFILER